MTNRVRNFFMFSPRVVFFVQRPRNRLALETEIPSASHNNTKSNYWVQSSGAKEEFVETSTTRHF